jgi:hypothetical protein
MNKTLTISVRNTFTDSFIISVSLPIERSKARFGEYSNMWKQMRLSYANMLKVDKNFIRASVKLDPLQTDRIIMTTQSGFKVNMPSDCTAVDLKILNLHLEAKALTL